MKKMLCRIICAILTLGNHLWKYGPYKVCLGRRYHETSYTAIGITCKLCGKIPGNQYELYQKKFKDRKRGRYVTNNSNNS